MKTTLINEICEQMNTHLTEEQNHLLRNTLQRVFRQFNIPNHSFNLSQHAQETNTRLLNLFIASKKIEGCSENTLHYYSSTLLNMVNTVQKNVCEIETDDIRFYLSYYQDKRNSSKVTLDNIRRIMSTFFNWLEDEDYIRKSPIRRIHKVKTTQLVKETLTDENLESLRDQCRHSRDLAIIDLLISTGIRVGELVSLNRSDINFGERECILERATKNAGYTSMPEPKSICSSTWTNAAMTTARFSSVFTRPGTVYLSPVLNDFSVIWAPLRMYSMYTRINSAVPWQQWQ